jgi:ribosomal 50S subunit-recycling heat shock protein
MRVDKFLKVSRILKRRTLAREAAEGGRVKVNGKTIKPSYSLKEGDLVELGFNSGTLKFRVLTLKDFVKKEDAENLYEIIEE